MCAEGSADMGTTDPPRGIRALTRGLSRSGPAVGLCLFSLAGFASLLPRWSRSLLSSTDTLSGDSVMHVWQFWWIRRAMEEEAPLLNTTTLFHPDPVDLASLWEGHLDLLLAAPLVSWATPFATANTVALVLFAACGIGAYSLAHALCRDRLAALAAAMLFLLSPTLLFEVGDGRTEAAAVGLAGPFLLCVVRWFTRGSRGSLVAAPLWLGLTVLGYLALGPMLVLLVPVLAVGALFAGALSDGAGRPAWMERTDLLRRTAIVLLPLGLLTAAALVFGAGRVVEHGLTPFSRGDDFDGAYQEWLAISDESCLTLQAGGETGLGLRGIAGPALFLLALAGSTLVSRRSAIRALPWWLGALLMYLLAFGPDLIRVEGRWYLPSPYRALAWLSPVFLRFHWPYRFLLVGDLCLAVLAAQGLSLIRARLGDRFPGWQRAALAGLVAVAVLLSGAYPLPARDVPPLPVPYRQLAAAQPTALLELTARCNPGPWRGPGGWEAYLYNQFVAQMEHDAPLCCLRVPEELRPDEVVARAAVDPTYAYLTWQGPAPENGLEAAGLAALGFSHVAVHLAPERQGGQGLDPDRSCPGDQLSVLVEHALGPPWIEEVHGRGVLRIYRVPPSPPSTTVRPGPGARRR